MCMQLNVYIPKARADILAELDRVSQETGRQKNDLVLEALERFLADRSGALGQYHMGPIKPWKRGDLYEERMSRIK